MKIAFLKLLSGIACFTMSFGLIAQNYVIDPSHTAITSKVVRFGVVKVVGRFNDVSGTVHFDKATPEISTAEILIKTDSYSANNTEGEKAVKSEAFLNVKSFPEIKIAVGNLGKTEAGYQVKANLTLHGVTKELSFPVKITGPLLDLPTQKQSIGISGTLIINRQDYGIAFARKGPNGVEIVGNDVEIEINALAVAQ